MSNCSIPTTSPVSHHKYDLDYRITLSPGNESALTVQMVRPNQELRTPDDRYIYKGLGTVTGTLDGEPVTGTAFTELESVK